MKKTKIMSAFLSLTLSMTSFGAVPVTVSAAETIEAPATVAAVTTTTAPAYHTTTVPADVVRTTTPSPRTTVQTTTTAAIDTDSYKECTAKVKLAVIDTYTGLTIEGVDVLVNANEPISFNTSETPEIVREINYSADNRTETIYSITLRNLPEEYGYEDNLLTTSLYLYLRNDGKIVDGTIRLFKKDEINGWDRSNHAVDPLFGFNLTAFIVPLGDETVIPLTNPYEEKFEAELNNEIAEIVSVSSRGVVVRGLTEEGTKLTLISESGKTISTSLLVRNESVNQSADSKIEEKNFFVVVGKYEGKYTQLRYYHTDSAGGYTADKVVWKEAPADIAYGDVFTAEGDVTMTRVQSAPDNPAYAMADYYDLDEGTLLNKVGNCADIMEQKELTVESMDYDGHSHWSIRYSGGGYYGLTTFGSSLDVDPLDYEVGDTVTFAVYNGHLIIPLAVNDAPQSVVTTAETTEIQPTVTTTSEVRLVSDLDTVRELFTEYFEENGFHAVCAEDGKYPEFAGKIVLEITLDDTGANRNLNVYSFADQNKINYNCFQYLPMQDGVPLTATTTAPGQTVDTTTTYADISKMNIVFDDEILPINQGETKKFAYELNGTDKVEFSSGNMRSNVEAVTEDGINYIIIDSSGAPSGLNYVHAVLGEWPYTKEVYIYVDVLPSSLEKCDFCGKMVPSDQIIHGPISQSCMDCYNERNGYIGGSTTPPPPTGTRTTTTTAAITTKNDQPVTTTAKGTVTSAVNGDANCDGELSMADAVLIMQSIANPARFGIKGTDENHITEQGRKNADITGENDGITNADALAIQKKLLKLD